MERREPGRTDLRRIVFLLCCVLLFSCAGNKPKQVFAYHNAATENIRTQGGITRLGNQPLTGILFSLNTKGDTLMRIPFVNGKENGMAKAWFPNGKLKEIRRFVNGKKEGRHFGWHENGKPRFEYYFSNDEFDGSFKEWLPNGLLLLSLNFRNGHESGMQQTWFEDGKIKSNYIIKNGRRYGLLGTKNCVNVSDSIPR